MAASTDVPFAASASVLAGFLTPDDLATQLGISRRTLARWHAGRVGPPRCTMGKLILYRIETVRDWLAGQERGPPDRMRKRR